MKRHSFDSFSFVVGAMLVAVGVIFLTGRDDGSMGLAWLAPTVLVGLGAACLCVGLQRMRRQ
jgi:hypothetical protein